VKEESARDGDDDEKDERCRGSRDQQVRDPTTSV